MTITGMVGLLALVLSLPLANTRLASRQGAPSVPSLRMADGKLWTTRNLDVDVGSSYCYDGVDDNCRRYGRLYTWASAPRACATLGTGWRLPSNDEWRQLGARYGGIRQDSADLGRAAYEAIKEGGPSKFEALLGGGRAPDGHVCASRGAWILLVSDGERRRKRVVLQHRPQRAVVRPPRQR